jgi:SAM-dependent methyltransferase
MKDESFALIAEYEESHFWFRARNDLIVWAFTRYFPSFRTFLEIGCGTGAVLSAVGGAFPSATLTGSERSEEGLRVAAHRVSGIRLVQMDARQIPYQEEFDVIGAFDVLEHIDDDQAVLAEMHHALVRGGGLIVAVPQHRWLWSAVDEYSQHYRRYTRKELTIKLASAGFRLEHVTSFMTLVLPAMLLSRITKRDAAAMDPGAELKLGGATNVILGWLCACEAQATHRGWSLPWGGSLLAVARKVD